MEEEKDSSEKVLFLKTNDSTRGKGPGAKKDKHVEVRYDLSKNYKKKNYKKRVRAPVDPALLCLTVCDHFLVLTFVAVNVVGFWRGLFGILSQLEDLYHLCFVYLLGSIIICHFTIARETYKKQMETNSICNSILRRGYTYIFGCACVAQWAGLWYFLDAMSGFDVYPPLAYSVICSAILIYIKMYRNVLAPPITFCTDSLDDYFEFKTVFNIDPTKKGTSVTSLYVLDCFFSVFVIGSLVVFVWRGIWCLTDVFLYPENEKFSAFGSLAIGYGIVIVVFSLQIPMESFCEKLSGFWRLLVADIYVFISFIGTINLWRGIWNLLNIYFLPESPVLSCWITHLGSFVLLVLIKCSNSTLVRGVCLDGEGGGKCVIFPISYLRFIFEKYLTKDKCGNGTNQKINSCEDPEKGLKENPENGKTNHCTNESSHEIQP